MYYGQASDFTETRIIFDNCGNSGDATIYGAHMYKINAVSGDGYELSYVVPAVMQGKRYTSATENIDYGYTYVVGDNDISFVYGNETMYFVPEGTAFNLDTINDDYKTRATPGFVDASNCFYSTKVATTASDIAAIATGKGLFGYSSGNRAIVFTI